MGKKLVILCLVLFLLPLSAVAEELHYSMLEKLYYQLKAGSGLEGTLTVEEKDGEPVTVDFHYIYTKTAEVPMQHMKLEVQGETPIPLDLSYTDEGLIIQEGASKTWVAIEGTEKQSDKRLTNAILEAVANTTVYLTQFSTLVDEFAVNTDVWLEGYRIETRLADSVLTSIYHIPPKAIKTHLKTMLTSIWESEYYTKEVQKMVEESYATLVFNPHLQSYYEQAIDELPLENDLVLISKINTQGEILYVSLALPFFDDNGEAVTLSYEWDGKTTLAYKQEESDIRLVYEYSEPSTYEGTLYYNATELDFTFASVQTQEGETPAVQTLETLLTVVSNENSAVVIPPIEVALTVKASSQRRQNAPTEISSEATVTYGDKQWTGKLTAHSKSPWRVETPVISKESMTWDAWLMKYAQ